MISQKNRFSISANTSPTRRRGNLTKGLPINEMSDF